MNDAIATSKQLHTRELATAAKARPASTVVASQRVEAPLEVVKLPVSSRLDLLDVGSPHNSLSATLVSLTLTRSRQTLAS